MISKCILPFSECPYFINDGGCVDIIDGPYNSDAKCFKINSKKKMLTRSKIFTPKYEFPPLRVSTYRYNTSNRKNMKVFIGDKLLCTLEWLEPILPGSYPRWWLKKGNMVSVGTNEIDAVNTCLEIYGYNKNDKF